MNLSILTTIWGSSMEECKEEQETQKKIMYELKDYLNAINFSKEKLLDTDDIMGKRNTHHTL